MHTHSHTFTYTYSDTHSHTLLGVKQESLFTCALSARVLGPKVQQVISELSVTPVSASSLAFIPQTLGAALSGVGCNTDDSGLAPASRRS